MRKLNLGCGPDYKEGWINVEILKNLKADKHHNLNKFPYPFKKDEFDVVLMKMILEHLDEPIKALREIIRISKKNARFIVTVPHANSYANLTDLQHKHNFTEHTFIPPLLEEYGLTELKLMRHKFLYPTNWWKKYIPFRKYLKIFFNGIYDDMLFEFRIEK
jgi:SAM-dependent methyltransferase